METETPVKEQTDQSSDQDPRVGLSNQPEEEIAKQILAWFKESAEGTSERRLRAKRNHRMYDNDQWDREDVQARGRRPTLTFNQFLTIIAAVEGQERNNRQEMKYYGRGGDDEPRAEKWTRLLKWIMDECGGEFVLSEQFHEMLISGEGWVVPELDYLDDPEGIIQLCCVPDDEMFDDPTSTNEVGTDARFRIRLKMLTEDEGEAMWPGKFKAYLKSYSVENAIGQETDGRGFPDIYLTPEKTNGPKLHEQKDKTWATLQCWWWEIHQGWVVKDEATGLLVEMDDEEFEMKKAEREKEQQTVLQSVLEGTATLGDPAMQPPMAMGQPAMPVLQMPPALEAERRPIKRVFEAFSVCDKLLEVGPIREKLKFFPAVPMRGLKRKSKKDYIGLVEPLTDAQRQHNVEQSILVELMQLMPKSSWMGPKGSFHNKKDWETGVAQPGKLLEYNGQRGKPEPITPPQIPRHLMELAFSRPQTMREVSGVNVELTGIRQGSDAGVVMEQRAKAAQTVLAPLFDNARRSKKLLGKVLLAFMQEHLTPGRQFRVLGPKGAELITVDNDMLEGRYDLVVDETTHSINDRVATLNLMQTTLPQLVDKGIPIPPGIIDLIPMDTNLREEWKRMIMWQLTLNNALPPEGWQPGMPAQLPPAASPTQPPIE